MTLGDIVANSVGNEDGEYVSGWDPDNDYLCTWGVVNNKGKETGVYKYLPKWQTEEDQWWEGHTPGWYASDDDDFANCMNGVKLPYGEGAVIKSNPSATLTFSGEVKAGITDVPVNKYKISGNSYPVSIKLGKIKTNSAGLDGEYASGWNPDDDYLCTWDVVSNKGKETGVYKYLPAWQTEVGAWWEGHTPGWYLSDDDDFANCYNEKVNLDPGDGFVIKSNPTSAITIEVEPFANK